MRDNWIEVELGDILETATGNTPSKKEPANYGNDIPFIKPPDLKDQRINTVSEFLSIEGMKKGRILQEGSVLVTCIGTLGRTGICKYPVSFNQQINAIKPDPNIIPEFTFYQIQNPYFRKEMERLSSATTVAILNKSKFNSIQYKLAPLPEQRAIVAKIEQLFSDLDNGIANLKDAKEKLTIYRQALLKKAFEGELTKEWRSQQTNLPTADQLLKQIKEERTRHYEQQLKEWQQAVTEWEKNGKEGKKPGKPKKLRLLPPLGEKEKGSLSHLPNKWFYDYLFYAGEMGRGKSKHRPRNDKQLFGGIYPFIQTGDVKAQTVITKYSQTYNKVGLAQSKLWPKGTLCITIAANIAETSFLGIDACFPDSIVGFTPFAGIFKSKYIEYFFRAAKSRIEAYAPATAQKNINLTTLENLVIPFCSIQEQNQIVQEIESRLSVCDKLAENIDASLQQSEALRQSILKRAFEGKLLTNTELATCRKEPDWEPAGKLLERT
ncbi:MAG: restriction endonuclease subunit S [Kiritimatiellae bacterium]|jgi:type I restriction enzyme S subunit|nr:restriction endonuclease subunit S [Kiritimatiellia bacterium]